MTFLVAKGAVFLISCALLQIKVCLRKEIDKRPSALELLQHPFVRNAADKAPVAELVEVCIDEIEDFRAAEMAELESEANRGTWEVGSMGTSSQLGHIRASVCNFFLCMSNMYLTYLCSPEQVHYLPALP